MTVSITAQNVWKNYRLWGRRSQFATLKSALLKRDLKFEPEGVSCALTVPVRKPVAFRMRAPRKG